MSIIPPEYSPTSILSLCKNGAITVCGCDKYQNIVCLAK